MSPNPSKMSGLLTLSKDRDLYFFSNYPFFGFINPGLGSSFYSVQKLNFYY